MKSFLLILINFYQALLSPIIASVFGIKGSCRFSPTCSNYAKESIAKYGAMRGGMMAIRRLSKCQPFYHARNNTTELSI
ncbi:MAG: membrane protein insertion efficiency factor YidD [Patescibacteria group bacterium]